MSTKNRVLVIGDAMIDTYVYGSIDRVSPEAPVPVVCPTRRVDCLGGAANVAQNSASLGAEVSVIFAVGEDENGEILRNELNAAGINCDYISYESSIRTIHKMRIVGNKQQIARIDWHDQYSIGHDLEDRIVARIADAIDDIDVVVLSDYGKGTCTPRICHEAIRVAHTAKKPIIVDPKGTNWEKYEGASLITPNLREINLFSGKQVANKSDEIEEAYMGVCDKIHIENLLITRSECGMTLFQGEEAEHFPANSLEVYDVSGAGDTVVAALASVLNHDMENLRDSVEISNIAAGIAVSKPGTAVVTMEEVQHEISSKEYDEIRQKVYTEAEWGRLERDVRFWKMAGDRIVTTNGCFDILHRGHIQLLEEASKMGTRLIVAVNSDDSVRRLKGDSRPVNSEMDRAHLLAALGMVDAVVIFDPAREPCQLVPDQIARLSEIGLSNSGEAPMKLLELLKPDVHVKGGDYRLEDIPEGIFAKETVLVPVVNGYSTTGTIQKAKVS